MDKKGFKYVALGKRLSGINEVLTLGVKPNFHDYTAQERDIILNSDLVLYPTSSYAQFFCTMGKSIYPSLETYLYSDDKIKQTTLFYLLGIRHPRTKFYYTLHFDQIKRDFQFPFVAKIPRASAGGRGVFLIEKQDDLDQYLQKTKVAYIQEYIPHQRDLRVILIGYKPILAYWRIANGSFKTNLYQGATYSFESIPLNALEYASYTAQLCKFNEVGLDLIYHQGEWHVLEANMHYGRRALKAKGMDLKALILDALKRNIVP